MYMLFKNNRPVGNKKFTAYEECRLWARKLARKQPMPTQTSFFGIEQFADVSRWLWRTPTLSDYGYEIRRV
jgi:hypothetical protein